MVAVGVAAGEHAARGDLRDLLADAPHGLACLDPVIDQQPAVADAADSDIVGSPRAVMVMTVARLTHDQPAAAQYPGEDGHNETAALPCPDHRVEVCASQHRPGLRGHDVRFD